MKRKAQSALESSVAYAVGALIFGGAMGIFGWGVAHIPARQGTYWATRVMAGSPHRYVDENGAMPTFMIAVWPTYFVGGGVTP
jgi:hypothetical protein